MKMHGLGEDLEHDRQRYLTFIRKVLGLHHRCIDLPVDGLRRIGVG